MSDGRLFRPIVRLDEVDSTNVYALRLAREGAPEGLVVTTERQRSGRGRRGREWVAPPGSSLLCSVLFSPRLDLEQFHLVGSALVLVALSAIAEQTGVRAEIKWPNDLVVADRKLAGVLAETIALPAGEGMTAGWMLVVGIGINCAWSPSFLDSPEARSADLATIATTLEAESGRTVDRALLLDAFLSELEKSYGRLASEEGRQATLAELRRSCSTIGRHVRVILPNGEWTGDAVGIAENGRLEVLRDGRLELVDAGDVVHLR